MLGVGNSKIQQPKNPHPPPQLTRKGISPTHGHGGVRLIAIQIVGPTAPWGIDVILQGGETRRG